VQRAAAAEVEAAIGWYPRPDIDQAPSFVSSLANAFKAPRLFAATALVSAASLVIVLVVDRLNDRLSHWRS
jgi:hypothetical protein